MNNPTNTPCVVCGTAFGLAHGGSRRPSRVSLAKHGVPGTACYSCYQTVRARVRRGADPLTGLPSRRGRSAKPRTEANP